jgi:hypothetical protein
MVIDRITGYFLFFYTMSMRCNGEHQNRCLSVVRGHRRFFQGARRFIRVIPTEKLMQLSISKKEVLSERSGCKAN